MARSIIQVGVFYFKDEFSNISSNQSAGAPLIQQTQVQILRIGLGLYLGKELTSLQTI